MAKSIGQAVNAWPARLLLATIVVVAATPCRGGAGIATDGSVGARQTITGANAGAGTFSIPQSLGALSGNNLFHSFSTFNIDRGQTAAFVTATASIANVISRVTGGSATQIGGLLQLTPAAGSAPAFFLINPAGVVFGAGASIDVPGGFHVSTADYVKFPGGEKFYADSSKTSALSSAAPEAFGFLGIMQAKISLKDGAGLGAKPLNPISVVAGDIELNDATVTTQGSGVRVVALGPKMQEVGFTGALPAAEGNLTILNGANVASSSLGLVATETMALSAGTIVIDSQGSSNRTGIFSKAVAGSANNIMNVEVRATRSLSITNAGRISSTTNSAGNAGTVKISAGNVTLDGTGGAFLTGIWSDTTGTGGANRVEIAATGNLSISNASEIFSDTAASGNTSLSSVKISAANISIDGKGNPAGTGIHTESQLTAGSVEVSTPGTLSLTKAGVISSNLFSSGNAGPIKVSAGSISIDGQGNSLPTGIFIQARAGSIDVSTTGTLSIAGAGRIASGSPSPGNAASLKVSADNIAIDGQSSTSTTGILSETSNGTGNAGRIEVVAANNISMLNGGAISADAKNGTGTAGAVKISAGSIAIGPEGGISSNSISSSGDAGSVEVSSTGALSIVNGGTISASSGLFSTGNAGRVKISAGSIAIDAKDTRTTLSHQTGILSAATGYSSGSGGSVEVTVTGGLSVANSGVISTSTSSSHDAGPIKIRAGSISIGPEDSASGSTNFTGILSEANIISSGSNAGAIDVTTAGKLSIFKGGQISSSTWSTGNAGAVKVSADSINIYDQGSWMTGILSAARTNSYGKAGSVEVTATGNLSLINGGIISSSADAVSLGGDAGTIKVSAGSITIDAQGSSDPAAGSLTQKPTGILSRTASFQSGAAGNIAVVASGDVSISNGGSISSVTLAGLGDAGAVTVTAGSIDIRNKAAIMSSTYARGNAGVVNVSADSIRLEGGYLLNLAESRSTGNAGKINVTATGDLTVTQGGSISSATKLAGKAGTVLINAGTLLVDGASSSIDAKAAAGSSGQSGSVIVAANDATLANGGSISIENQASVAFASSIAPTLLTLTAPRITLINSPNAITTKSTGNVAAGNIKIIAADKLTLDPSGITTTSNKGNGGAIDITAGTLWLDNSQIATSVTGLSGNGGNISIATDSLVMNTSFIQANTAAANASGGLVSISAQNLIPSGNTLFVGGSTPYAYQPGVFGFNVIQAAAPTGISGVVQISSPTLDVSASLVGLNTRAMTGDALARHPCENTGGSSLAAVGRGGLPLTGVDFLSPGQLSHFGFTAPTRSPAAGPSSVRTVIRTAALAPCAGTF